MERKNLEVEKKNIEEKRKEIEEKLARLQAQGASSESAMACEDLTQKPASIKRKLKAPEKPRDFDPYAFEEMDRPEVKPKPTKNSRKHVPNTPQQKKVPTAFSGGWKRKLAGAPLTPVPSRPRKEPKVTKFDNLLQFSSPEPSSP